MRLGKGTRAEELGLNEQLRLGLGGGEAGGGQDFFIECDEEAFAAGQNGAVGALEFGLVEELAVGSSVGFDGSVEVAGYKD